MAEPDASDMPTTSSPAEVRFSVFLPVMNGGWWLAGAIDSVLAQTYSNWELVIGDNASDDDTTEVVARYADPRIRYHHWSERVDICTSYNRTAALAGYEWVHEMSADDRLHPECLEVLAERIRTAQEEDGRRLAMALTRARRVDPEGNDYDVQYHGFEGRQPLADGRYGAAGWLAATCRPGSHPWGFGSASIARSVLDEIGRYYSTDDPTMQMDTELALTVAAYGDVVYVDRPLVDITISPQSDSPARLARDRGAEHDLSADGAAFLAGLRMHEAQREVSAAERRVVFSAIARSSLKRATTQRYLPGGGGRAAAWRDVCRAIRFSPRTMLSPARIARAIFVVAAPRSVVVQVRQRTLDRRTRRETLA